MSATPPPGSAPPGSASPGWPPSGPGHESPAPPAGSPPPGSVLPGSVLPGSSPPDSAPPGSAPPGRRPLVERLGLGLIALVVAVLFGGMAAAAFAGGEMFLAAMSALGALMTAWVGALTLVRGK